MNNYLLYLLIESKVLLEQCVVRNFDNCSSEFSALILIDSLDNFTYLFNSFSLIFVFSMPPIYTLLDSNLSPTIPDIRSKVSGFKRSTEETYSDSIVSVWTIQWLDTGCPIQRAFHRITWSNQPSHDVKIQHRGYNADTWNKGTDGPVTNHSHYLWVPMDSPSHQRTVNMCNSLWGRTTICVVC